jgi:hypothetical protein
LAVADYVNKNEFGDPVRSPLITVRLG